MAAVTGKKIKNTYKDFLQVSNSNSGIDGTLRDVEDGEGTVGPFQVSSTTLTVPSGKTIDVSGTFDLNSAVSFDKPIGFTASTLTLSSGSVTGTGSRHVIDVESGTDDDWDTLATDNYSAGDVVYATCTAGKTVRMTLAGNFSQEWVLSETHPVMLMLIGSTWVQLNYHINPSLGYNGDMQVAQRGTVTGVDGQGDYGGADGQNIQRQAGTEAGRFTLSQESSGGPTGFPYWQKVLVTTAESAVAAGEAMATEQTLEGQDLQHLLKGTANAKSLTFQSKVIFHADAASSLTFPVTAGFYIYDVDNDRSYVKEFDIAAADTFQDFIHTVPGDTTGALDNDSAASLVYGFCLYAGANSQDTDGTWEAGAGLSTANQDNLADAANNYFGYTAIKLEVSPYPTPFDHTPEVSTLKRCQRYLNKTFELGTAPAQNAGLDGAIGGIGSGSRFAFTWNFPVRMRTKPTVTLYNPSAANSSVRNLIDSTDTAGDASTNVGESGVLIRSGATDATDDGDVMAVHALASAEL